jgi:hypothetical protein
MATCRNRRRFSDVNEAGPYLPEAMDFVISGGASVDNFHKTFASLRLRYLGPRPLLDDNSVRSKATTLLNAEVGYQISKRLRLNLEIFNLGNSSVSDIDYYFASRLLGEPLEDVEDLEVLTPHYRGAHAAGKTSSGFTCYRAIGARLGAGGASGRGGGRGFDPHVAEEFLG